MARSDCTVLVYASLSIFADPGTALTDLLAPCGAGTDGVCPPGYPDTTSFLDLYCYQVPGRAAWAYGHGLNGSTGMDSVGAEWLGEGFLQQRHHA
jgi:hypothetical protein